jgi:hypothetical protein
VAAAECRDDDNVEPVALNDAQEALVVESVTYTVAGALGLAVDGYATRTSRRGLRTPT